MSKSIKVLINICIGGNLYIQLVQSPIPALSADLRCNLHYESVSPSLHVFKTLTSGAKGECLTAVKNKIGAGYNGQQLGSSVQWVITDELQKEKPSQDLSVFHIYRKKSQRSIKRSVALESLNTRYITSRKFPLLYQ